MKPKEKAFPVAAILVPPVIALLFLVFAAQFTCNEQAYQRMSVLSIPLNGGDHDLLGRGLVVVSGILERAQ